MNLPNVRQLLPFVLTILFLFSGWSSAQTTEDFEDESGASVAYLSNGKQFLILGGNLKVQDGFPGTGWNGSAPDNKYLDNSDATSGSYDAIIGEIIPGDGIAFLVKSLYLFVGDVSADNGNVPNASISLTGYVDGNMTPEFVITKNSGFVNDLGSNNGFTFIDFSTEGGVDNSNTPIDRLVIETNDGTADTDPTGEARYLAIDAFVWDELGTPANYTIGNNDDSGPGSLRQAILDANSNAGAADIIDLSGLVPGSTINLSSPLPAITDDLTVIGPTGGVIIPGNSPVFDVTTVGTDLTLSDVIITGGSNPTGGGINFDQGVGGGTLTLTRVRIDGNTATSGGGIYYNSDATSSITQSTIVNNDAATGAGIAIVRGSIDITNSTIGNNLTGSGISVDGTAGGQVNLSHVTVSGNADRGIHATSGGLVSAEYSIFYLNGADDIDVGAPGDLDFLNTDNIVGTQTPGTATNDAFVIATDPVLGALSTNGDHTDGFLPATTGAAVDGDVNGTTSTSNIDQAGSVRPQRSARDLGSLEAANTLPTSSDFTLVVGVDGTLIFANADIPFSDSDGDSRASVEIVTLPASGVLYIDGNANDSYDGGEEVSATDVITEATITAGDLQYEGASIPGSSTFTFTVNDGFDDSTPANTATLYSVENALDFGSSTDAYVDLGTGIRDDLVGSGALTVEAWVRPTGAQFYKTIITNFVLPANAQFLFRIDDSFPTLWIDNGTAGTTVTSATTVPADTWSHIAATYDGSNIRIYINGEETGSVPYSGNLGNVGGNVTVGGNQGGPANEYMKGTIDEVRLWDVARTPQEIRANAAQLLTDPTSEANLLLYYDFNQGVPDGSNNIALVPSILDRSGNGNDGTPMGFDFNGGTSVLNLTGSTAFAAAEPNIRITEGGLIEIANGGGYQFGVYNIRDGATDSETIIINNDGLDDLTIAAAGSIAITGTAFTLDVSGLSFPLTIAPGTSETFQIDFTAPADAVLSASETLTITSDDPNDPNYSFGVAAYIVENALDFDGTDNFVETPNDAAFGFDRTDAFSIEMWVSTSDNSIRQRLVDKNNVTNGYYVELTSLGEFSFYMRDNAANEIEITSATGAVTNDTWYHLAVTYDGSNVESGMHMYVNGVEVALSVTTGTLSGSVLNAENLNLGRDISNSNFLNGSLDELRIWNDVRTPLEIRANAASRITGAEAGLVLYYDFNDGIPSGDNTGRVTALDLSPSGNDGTLNNFDVDGTNNSGNTSNWVASTAFASTAATTPNMVVTESATIYPDGGTAYDYGTQTLASNTDATFTITNQGLADLNLTAAPSLNDGTNYSIFSGYGAATMLTPGQTQSLTVRYTPTTAAVHPDYVIMASNDATTDPYHLNLTGTGQALVGITAATWLDSDFDGDIDQLQLDFSETVDITDGGAGADGFPAIVISGGTITIDNVDLSGAAFDAITTLTLNVSGATGTADPGVTVTYDEIAGPGNTTASIVGSQEIVDGAAAQSYVDGAAPVVIDAFTVDADADGFIDGVELEFSESIDDDNAGGDLSLLDVLTYAGDTPDALNDDDQFLTVSFTEDIAPNYDTDATPNVDIPAGAVADATGNTRGAIQNFTATQDGAGPAIVAALTDDIDGDGHIDQLTITFSENIDDGASDITSTGIDVSGYVNEGPHGTNYTDDDDDVIVIEFDEIGGFDTGATPNIDLLASGIVDAGGNAAVQTFTGTEDGADPIIASLDMAAANAYADITFSEGIYSGGGGALLDTDLTVTIGGTAQANFTGITALTQNDNTDQAAASALGGGESVVRMFFTYSNGSLSTDLLIVDPANGTAIEDGAISPNNAPSPLPGTLNEDNFFVSTVPTFSAAELHDTDGNGYIDRLQIYFGSFNVSVDEDNQLVGTDGLSCIEITYNGIVIDQVAFNYDGDNISSGSPLTINLDPSDTDIPAYTGSQNWQVEYVFEDHDTDGFNTRITSGGAQMDFGSLAPIVDEAAPFIGNFTATLIDNNQDGNADRLVVDPADEVIDSSLDPNDFSYNGSLATGIVNSNDADGTFTLTVIGTSTAVQGDLTILNGASIDGGGNTNTVLTLAADETVAAADILDDADPILLSSTTGDGPTPDGVNNFVDLVFSEALVDGGTAANYTIGGETGSSVTHDGTSGVRVFFPNGGNTTATPSVNITASNVVDLETPANGNLLTTGFASDDGAAPFAQLEDADADMTYDNYPRTYLTLSPTITGVVDDPNALVFVQVDGSGALATVDGAGNWSVNLNVSDKGTYDVDVTTFDNSGNIGSEDKTYSNEIEIDGGVVITVPDIADLCINTETEVLPAIVFTEQAVGDFQGSGDFLLQLPTGFLFDTDVAPTFDYDGDATPEDVTVTYSYIGNAILQLTFTLETPEASAGIDEIDVISISGLNITANSGASANAGIQQSMNRISGSADIFGASTNGVAYATMTAFASPSTIASFDIPSASPVVSNATRYAIRVGDSFTFDVTDQVTGGNTITWYYNDNSVAYQATTGAGGATASEVELNGPGFDNAVPGLYTLKVTQLNGDGCESIPFVFNVLVFDDDDQDNPGNPSFITRTYNVTDAIDNIYISNPAGHTVNLTGSGIVNFATGADPAVGQFDPNTAGIQISPGHTITYSITNNSTGATFNLVREYTVQAAADLFNSSPAGVAVDPTGVYCDVLADTETIEVLDEVNGFTFNEPFTTIPFLIDFYTSGQNHGINYVIGGADLYNGLVNGTPYQLEFDPTTFNVPDGDFENVYMYSVIQDETNVKRVGAEDYFIIYGLPAVSISNISDGQVFCSDETSFTIQRDLSYVSAMNTTDPANPVPTYASFTDQDITNGYYLYKQDGGTDLDAAGYPGYSLFADFSGSAAANQIFNPGNPDKAGGFTAAEEGDFIIEYFTQALGPNSCNNVVYVPITIYQQPTAPTLDAATEAFGGSNVGTFGLIDESGDAFLAANGVNTNTYQVEYCVGDNVSGQTWVATEQTADQIRYYSYNTTTSSFTFLGASHGGMPLDFYLPTSSNVLTGATSVDFYFTQVVNGCESEYRKVNVDVYSVPDNPDIDLNGFPTDAQSGDFTYFDRCITYGGSTFTPSVQIDATAGEVTAIGNGELVYNVNTYYSAFEFRQLVFTTVSGSSNLTIGETVSGTGFTARVHYQSGSQLVLRVLSGTIVTGAITGGTSAVVETITSVNYERTVAGTNVSTIPLFHVNYLYSSAVGTGNFVPGETVTGSISGTTATVEYQYNTNYLIVRNLSGYFEPGETISSASASRVLTSSNEMNPYHRYQITKTENINPNSDFAGCTSNTISYVYDYGWVEPLNPTADDFSVGRTDFHVREGAVLGSINHTFDGVQEYTWYQNSGKTGQIGDVLEVGDVMTVGTLASVGFDVNGSNAANDVGNDAVNDVYTYYVSRSDNRIPSRDFDGCESPGTTPVTITVHTQQTYPTITSDNTADSNVDDFVDLNGAGNVYEYAVCLNQVSSALTFTATSAYPANDKKMEWYPYSGSRGTLLFTGEQPNFSNLQLVGQSAGTYSFQVVQVTDTLYDGADLKFAGTESEIATINIILSDPDDLEFQSVDFTDEVATPGSGADLGFSDGNVYCAEETNDEMVKLLVGDPASDPILGAFGGTFMGNPTGQDTLSYEVYSYVVGGTAPGAPTLSGDGYIQMDFDAWHTNGGGAATGGSRTQHDIYFQYSDPITQCVNQASATIYIDPQPDVTFTMNASSAATIDVCVNTGEVDLQGLFNGGGSLTNATGGTFTTAVGAAITDDPSSNEATFNPLIAQGNDMFALPADHTVFFTYVTEQGCDSTVSKVIHVNPAPEVLPVSGGPEDGDFFRITNICDDGSNSVIAEIKLVDPDDGPGTTEEDDYSSYSFAWTLNGSPVLVPVLDGGRLNTNVFTVVNDNFTVGVTVTDLNTCSNLTAFSETHSKQELPDLDIVGITDGQEFCSEDVGLQLTLDDATLDQSSSTTPVDYGNVTWSVDSYSDDNMVVNTIDGGSGTLPELTQAQLLTWHIAAGGNDDTPESIGGPSTYHAITVTYTNDTRTYQNIATNCSNTITENIIIHPDPDISFEVAGVDPDDGGFVGNLDETNDVSAAPDHFCYDYGSGTILLQGVFAALTDGRGYNFNAGTGSFAGVGANAAATDAAINVIANGRASLDIAAAHGGPFNVRSTHEIEFTYIDEFGCENSVVETIYINPRPEPLAVSNMPVGPEDGDLIRLTNFCNDGSNQVTAEIKMIDPTDPTGTVEEDSYSLYTFAWTINGSTVPLDGDVGVGIGLNSNHMTVATEDFSIGVTVTDMNGCSQTYIESHSKQDLPSLNFPEIANLEEFCITTGLAGDGGGGYTPLQDDFVPIALTMTDATDGLAGASLSGVTYWEVVSYTTDQPDTVRNATGVWGTQIDVNATGGDLPVIDALGYSGSTYSAGVQGWHELAGGNVPVDFDGAGDIRIIGGPSTVHTIYVTYTDPSRTYQGVNTNCEITYAETIIIHPNPDIDFTYAGASNFDPDGLVMCYDDADITLRGLFAGTFGNLDAPSNGTFYGFGVGSTSNSQTTISPSDIHDGYWENETGMAGSYAFWAQSSNVITFEYEDGNGCWHSVTKTIYVDPRPNIDIDFDEGTVDAQINFDAICKGYPTEASVTIMRPKFVDGGDATSELDVEVTDFTGYDFVWQATDSDGNILNYSSLLGDPEVFENTVVIEADDENINRTVTVTVTSPDGCTVVLTDTETQGFPPEPSFTYVGITANSTDGLDVQFQDNNALLPDGNIDTLAFELRTYPGGVLVDSEYRGTSPAYLAPGGNFFAPHNILGLDSGQYEARVWMGTPKGCIIPDSARVITILPLKTLNLGEVYSENFDEDPGEAPFSTDPYFFGDWYIEVASENGKNDTTRLSSWTRTTLDASVLTNDDITSFFATQEGVAPVDNGNMIVTQAGAFIDSKGDPNETSYYSGEVSFVYSPAFDISAFENPAISFDYIRDFDSSRDGLVVQVSDDDGRTWYTLGDNNINSGINWYSDQGISAAPGVNVGRTPETGFSPQQVGFADVMRDDNDLPTPTWLNARHKVNNDNVSTETNFVRFRFALGAGVEGDENKLTETPDGLGYENIADGFAFDNFRVYEVNKLVLVEMFSTALTNESKQFSDFVYGDPTGNIWDLGTEGILINYYTDMDNSGNTLVDPINARNKIDPSTRATFYGVSDVPDVRIAGEIVDSDLNENPEDFRNKFNAVALGDVDFEITSLTLNPSDADVLSVSATFESQVDVEEVEVAFFFAIVEKVKAISTQDAQGNTVYTNSDEVHYALRVLLPGPEGSYYRGSLSDGDNFDQSIDWTISGIDNPDNIRVIAFAQFYDHSADGGKIGNVDQSAWVDLDGQGKTNSVVGLEDLVTNDVLSLYPNPADSRVTMRLADAPMKPVMWRISDQSGKQVMIGRIERGIKEVTIDTEELPSGMYIIQIFNDKNSWIPKKVIIAH